MKCPACERQLKAITIGDVTVDVCWNGCGGIWFDNFEIKKFDEPFESVGEQLLDIPKDTSITVDQNKRYNCPKCDSVVMMRHPFSFKQQVTIDECPVCAGIWLDDGELAKIREMFTSEEEKDGQTATFVEQMIGKKLADLEEQDHVELARAQRFANMFKWICPSHYISGKQTWGAF